RRADERVGGDEGGEELLESRLATLLEHRVDVRGRVDAFGHHRPDQVFTAGLLAQVFEEGVRLAVMSGGRLDVGPVVELRVRYAEIGLRRPDGVAVRFLAELRLTLVEPDRRALPGVDLVPVAD